MILLVARTGFEPAKGAYGLRLISLPAISGAFTNSATSKQAISNK